MARKGRLIVGTGIILTCAAGFFLSEKEEPVEYEEGKCYYLVPAKRQETGLEWKQIDCDALEALLEEHPETAYVAADGIVHSPLDSSVEEERREEEDEGDEADDSCLNPYDEGLDVDEKIDRAACWYDLRPDFLRGLWEVESKRQHTSPDGSVKESYAGALGIGQVMPGHTGNSVVDSHELDIYEEVDNMELGMQVLLGKCRSAAAIANANGFETRSASEEEPCGAIHYVCVGSWGNAWPSHGSVPGSLADEWYTAPEDVMARAYNGISCGGNLIGRLGWVRGRIASYWTIRYVEKVQNEGGGTDHSFDDAP